MDGQVDTRHIELLKNMQQKYQACVRQFFSVITQKVILCAIKLADVSKAVRIVVQFAMKEVEEKNKIFSETDITTCGDILRKGTLTVDLYPRQKAFLDNAAREIGLGGHEVRLRARHISRVWHVVSRKL